jgi:hypothetical protein
MCKRQSHVTVPLALLAIAFTRSSLALDSEARKPQQTPPTISTVQGVLAIPGAIVAKNAPRELVMRQLSKLYELQRLRSAEGAEDSWLISEKQEVGNSIGGVSFAGGKVRRVARSVNGRRATIRSN